MLKNIVLAGLFALSLATPVWAQDDGPHARIALIPEKATITAGETVTFAIRQDMEEGWHTYWLNPGDSGEPMRLRWAMPPGFAAGDVQWPVPSKIVTGPLASYGYHDTAVMLVPVTAPADLADGPVTIGLDMTVLVCADICIPESSTHTVTLNGTADIVADAALIAQARAALPRDLPGVHRFSEAAGDFLLKSDVALPGAAQIFPYEWGLIDNMAQTQAGLDGTLRHARGDRPLRALNEARFLLRDADGTAVVVTAQADPATAAPAPETSGTVDASGGMTFILALAFAFIGGMILNLMPCVFPVLFMKALSLCQIAHEEEREVRLQAMLYAAGILVTFAGVAGALMALRAAGAEIGWGFQLQNPAVIAVLAYLFFVIGLNLAGLFEISGRFAGAGEGLLHKGGKHGHAFFMGVLATVVATPCTAPFMGVAMGYALVQPPVMALAVFLALGLGLAAPYVALSYIPPLRRALPRPGPWMDGFRRVLAVPMLLTVLWLVWVYGHQTGSYALWAGLALLVGAALLWRRQVMAVLSVLLVAGALGLGFYGGHNVTAAAPAADIHEEAYSEERLTALLAGSRPVFVNMTADWCITCKVNEKVALSVDATQHVFADNNVAYLEGDWTRQDPAITKFLEGYGRNGVPLYVFYPAPDAASGLRPDPVILPQLLTPGLIAKTIKGEP